MNEIIWGPGITLEQIEKQVILKALLHFKYHKLVTAQALGIAIRTLDTRLEKYELEEKNEKERQDAERRKREEHLMRARGNPPNNIGAIFTPTAKPIEAVAVVTQAASVAVDKPGKKK